MTLDSLDYALSDSPVLLRGEVGEDVAFRVLEDLERHGAVMVLQRGDVIVTQS